MKKNPHRSMSGLSDSSPLLRYLDKPEDDVGFGSVLKMICGSSLPIFFVYFTTLARDNIALHFLKDHDDNRLLNAIGIGTTYIDVFAASMFISLNIGLTSKASKVFAVENYHLVGIYSQKSLVLNTIVLIPGCLLAYFSDKVCITIGYDYQTSMYVQEYLSSCIFGLFAFMIFNTQVATLYACQKFYVPALIEIFGAVMYWTLAYILIGRNGMTIKGVSICFNAMYAVTAICILLYQKLWDPVPGTFFWFSKRSFRGIWSHFKTEVFIGATVFLEWIADEIVYMFGGVLSVNELTALTIANNNLFILESIPLSLMDTLLSYMGNAMAENNAKKAKRFLVGGLFISTIGLIIIEVIFLTLPEYITQFYTNDPSTMALASKILRITVLGYISDFSKNILMAGLTAIGKEKIASKITLFCYYLIEIPLSYCLCFFAGLNSTGLALGQAITPYIILICLLFVYSQLNWKNQASVVSEEANNQPNYQSFILDNDPAQKETLQTRKSNKESSILG